MLKKIFFFLQSINVWCFRSQWVIMLNNCDLNKDQNTGFLCLFQSQHLQAFSRCISSFSSTLQLRQIHMYIQHILYVQCTIHFASLSQWIRCYSGFFSKSNSSILSIFKVHAFVAPYIYGKSYIYIQYTYFYIVHTHTYSMTYFMSLSKRQTIQSNRDLLWK